MLMGFLLRCPNCEKGKLFSGGSFDINPTCPNCGVRFERQSGESLGGMMINLVTAEILTVGGWILTEVLFDFPWQYTLAFWVVFNIVFCIAFYRSARGIWVAISYMGGGVYADSENKK